MTFFILICWFILSLVVASAASQRGRSAFAWLLFSIVFSPLIAGLFLLLFPPISSIDDHALQGSIRAANQLTTAVQELRGTIREGRIETPEFAPMRERLVEWEPEDRVSRGAIVAERVTEPLPQKRGIRGLIAFSLFLTIAIAFAAFGISNMSENRVADSGSNKLISAAGQPDTNNKTVTGKAPPEPLDYAAVASLSCVKLLDAYGTTQFSPLTEPLIETISSRGDGLGSGINILSFVATECRLHETITVGQAVENLFDQQRRNRLPRIPIGGATADPEAQATWDAFDKWIHHKGPRPVFPPLASASTQSTSALQPLSGRYCDAVGKYIAQHNQADKDFVSRLPPENPNSPKNPDYKPPYAWKVLYCDETNDSNRVGGMIDMGGGSPWYFEASKSAYPFSSGGKDIRLAVCLEAITREDDILGVPACRASGELRKICDTTPRLYKCENAPDQRGCARRNAICAKDRVP